MATRLLRFDIRQAGGRILLALLALLLVNVVAYLLLVRPKVQEYRELLDRSGPRFELLDERTAEVEANEAFLAAVEQARRDLRTLREEVLSTRDERMVSVQAVVERLANQFSADFESVTYENSLLEEEGLDRMAMTLPLEGGYANLRRFLQAVEDSEEFLVVERVGLGQGKQGGVLLQLDITLATYFNAPVQRERRARRVANGRS